MFWGQMNFQESNSSIMENMIMFHDHAMMVILMIVVLIMYMLIFMLFNKFINRNILDGQLIEIIWTLIPIVFLLFLAIPSLTILYLMEEISNSFFSVKVIGHQWYWSYEYSDFLNLSFDSFMISDYLDNKDIFRLLDVDNRMILPFNNQIRFLVTSSDVIHSFALPSLSLKVDAMPGRINQMMMDIYRPGIYYGQCSEICGVNHSFMPIVLESTSFENFFNWVKNF